MIVEDERTWQESRIGMLSRSIANTGAAFQPTTVSEEPLVTNGEVKIGKVLTMTFLADHYLIDGYYGMMAIRYLRDILLEPSRLGLCVTCK